jgi:hypothetical protein
VGNKLERMKNSAAKIKRKIESLYSEMKKIKEIGGRKIKLYSEETNV